jgi:hypothetical protein
MRCGIRSPSRSATDCSGTSQTRALPAHTQVMALAFQSREMIDRGEIRGHADLAWLGCVNHEQISALASRMRRTGQQHSGVAAAGAKEQEEFAEPASYMEYVEVLAADPDNQTFTAIFTKGPFLGRPTICLTPFLNEGDDLTFDFWRLRRRTQDWT